MKIKWLKDTSVWIDGCSLHAYQRIIEKDKISEITIINEYPTKIEIEFIDGSGGKTLVSKEYFEEIKNEN